MSTAAPMRRRKTSIQSKLLVVAKEAMGKESEDTSLTGTPREGIELPKGWRWVTLGEVTESMKNGIYKAASFYAEDGFACLRMYNIGGGKIVWRDIKRMRLSEDEIREYELLPGDILVNRVNSRELVGKAVAIPAGLERCVFESKNIRVRLRSELLQPAEQYEQESPLAEFDCLATMVASLVRLPPLVSARLTGKSLPAKRDRVVSKEILAGISEASRNHYLYHSSVRRFRKQWLSTSRFDRARMCRGTSAYWPLGLQHRECPRE
jgi:hypothetical protein